MEQFRHCEVVFILGARWITTFTNIFFFLLWNYLVFGTYWGLEFSEASKTIESFFLFLASVVLESFRY